MALQKPQTEQLTQTEYQPDDFELAAINLVRNEKKNYEQSSKYIRDRIKKARQNYACKFDDDKTTNGLQKFFVPITRWEVDAVVPKIMVNDKAVTVIPENEESVRSAFIADKVLKYQIRETRFPTYFRNSMYDLGIDGTTVWAIYWNFEREVIEKPTVINKIKKGVKKVVDKVKNALGMKKINVLKDKIGYKQIDILNCWIDPTADSIQDAQSFIYRNAMPLEQVKRNTLYSHTEDLQGYLVEKNDTYDSRSTNQFQLQTSTIQYEQPMCSIYERWGRFSKSYLTKKEEDKAIMIDGVITVADLEDGGKPVLLRIDTNPFDHGMKPFEECWFQKKIGRWYGLGMGEKLIDVQAYFNKTVTRRWQNEDMLHSGLWKVRRGSGISAKSIVSTPGGIIEVEKMEDIQQLAIQDTAQLSNGTLEMLKEFTERINGASQVALGDSADRSATTSLIKDRNADTRFAATRGYVNDFLSRLFSQWLANDRQFIDKDFVIRVTGEDAELQQIDDTLGLSPEVRSQLPNYRFINVSPETIKGDFGLEVDIDQSLPMNKAENAQRLLQGIQTGVQLGIPADYQKMYYEWLNFIGLQGSKFKLNQNQGTMVPGMATPQQVPTELEQFMNAHGAPNQQPGQPPQAGTAPMTNSLPKLAAAQGESTSL